MTAAFPYEQGHVFGLACSHAIRESVSASRCGGVEQPRRNHCGPGPSIGFSRHGKSSAMETRLVCLAGWQRKGRHVTHRPIAVSFAGYSSAGCFPAEPASASPDIRMESGAIARVKPRHARHSPIPVPLPTRCRQIRKGRAFPLPLPARCRECGKRKRETGSGDDDCHRMTLSLP